MRRTYLLICFCLSLLCSSNCCAAEVAADSPNIIFVMAADLGWIDLGYIEILSLADCGHGVNRNNEPVRLEQLTNLCARLSRYPMWQVVSGGGHAA